MTNVVKFPRQEDSKQQQGQPVENAAGQTSGAPCVISFMESLVRCTWCWSFYGFLFASC